MIQRTFSSPFFIQFQIRSDHPSELLRQKRTFSWPIPNLLVIIPLSKSELTLCETPELVFFTIPCSISSFSHVPSSIIYHLSRFRGACSGLGRNRARQSYGFTADPASPKTAEPPSLSLFVFINLPWGVFYHTRKTYSVLVTGKVKYYEHWK